MNSTRAPDVLPRITTLKCSARRTQDRFHLLCDGPMRVSKNCVRHGRCGRERLSPPPADATAQETRTSIGNPAQNSRRRGRSLLARGGRGRICTLHITMTSGCLDGLENDGEERIPRPERRLPNPTPRSVDPRPLGDGANPALRRGARAECPARARAVPRRSRPRRPRRRGRGPCRSGSPPARRAPSSAPAAASPSGPT